LNNGFTPMFGAMSLGQSGWFRKSERRNRNCRWRRRNNLC